MNIKILLTYLWYDVALCVVRYIVLTGYICLQSRNKNAKYDAANRL